MGHRTPVEPGQEVVDGELGHPLARVARRRPDVRRDDQVRHPEKGVVGRQRLGIGDVERGAGILLGCERVGEVSPVDRRRRGPC